MSVINTNIMSLNAQRHLSNSQSSMQTSMERLSSGLRINSAKDDAAGLAIGKLMGNQVASFGQAIRNANDGISLVQTAEGALEELQVMTQRVKELATQASNGTLQDSDKTNIQAEIAQIAEEIGDTFTRAKFNGVDLLSQSEDVTVDLQVGANSGEQITVTIKQLDLSGLTDVDVTTDAQGAMDAADTAMTSISELRANLGAYQNRLGHTVSNLQVMSENLSAAKSRIMDADFAAETANLTRAQVLQQAGTAMLAQANQAPQNVLSLLR